MKRVLRGALTFVAGAAVLLALEARGRRRGARAGAAAGRLLALLRPAPIRDEAVAARVRAKLVRTARDPAGIRVTIERGCVELRGRVETRQRGRIVRAVAAVPGVDSVVDLMTEPPVREARGPF
jgi:hypothetical protein